MSGSYGGYRNSVSKERRTIEFGKADTRKQAICERKFSGIGTVVLRLPLPLNLPNSRSGFLCEMYENHLSVTVELGRTNKSIKEILELTNGSIVELDKLAGEPVDINVNGKFLAKGEVVVIDENFGVRITEIASPAERAAKLQ